MLRLLFKIRQALSIAVFGALFCLFALFSETECARANETNSVKKFTFFAGTQYAMDFYYLEGKEPGPTIMVQGGIQGDESAGFITAQILVNSKVRRGNVLIVPRANPPSIHARTRQINVDLNRRFDQDYKEFYEDRLARAIRFLLGRCQALIHLHEGSGFYSPVYVNANRNPKRYGQSIIIDADVFADRIYMENAVKEVLKTLNKKVEPKEYRFELFNTDTFNPRTSHSEQLKSLTCYALKGVGIPALAIEVSKSISDLDWKVRYQLEATAAFLHHFGVYIEIPQLVPGGLKTYPKDTLNFEVNGFPLEDGMDKAQIGAHTPLKIKCKPKKDIPLAPLPAVFAADRPGVNLNQAPRMPLEPIPALEIRADGVPIGLVNISLKKGHSPKPKSKIPKFAIWHNGEYKVIPAGSTFTALEGDQLFLEGIVGGVKGEVVNFRGYVTQPGKNDGQDIGQEIILERNSIIPRFELTGSTAEKSRYEIRRETPGQERVSFILEVASREVQAIQLRNEKGETITLPWKPGKLSPIPSGTYILVDVHTNGAKDKILTFHADRPLSLGDSFILDPYTPAEFTLRQSTTFEELGRMPILATLPKPLQTAAAIKADGALIAYLALP